MVKVSISKVSPSFLVNRLPNLTRLKIRFPDHLHNFILEESKHKNLALNTVNTGELREGVSHSTSVTSSQRWESMGKAGTFVN